MTSFTHYLLWLVLRVYAFTRPSVTIYLDGRPYLRRWFLTCTPSDDSSGPPGYYLHEWHAPDADRRLHNHPWTHSRTRILRGGYVELRQNFCTRGTLIKCRRVGDTASMGARTRHRVASLLPNTWTLFWADVKHGRGWGPKGEGGWLEWHAPEWSTWLRGRP